MIGFPLLLIPLAIYLMIAFLAPLDWAGKLYTFQLKSGLTWEPTVADAFIVFSLIILMFEFIKSMKHGKSLVEHFLSLLLAGGAVAGFVMVDPAKVLKTSPMAPAAMSVFVLLIAILFVDLFAGFAASLRRARRKVVVAEAEPVVVVAPPPAPRAEPVRVEPAPVRVEPVRVEPVRTEAARAEPANPFTRVEPAAPPELVRTEPVVKIEPVQKTGS